MGGAVRTLLVSSDRKPSPKRLEAKQNVWVPIREKSKGHWLWEGINQTYLPTPNSPPWSNPGFGQVPWKSEAPGNSGQQDMSPNLSSAWNQWPRLHRPGSCDMAKPITTARGSALTGLDWVTCPPLSRMAKASPKSEKRCESHT